MLCDWGQPVISMNEALGSIPRKRQKLFQSELASVFAPTPSRFSHNLPSIGHEKRSFVLFISNQQIFPGWRQQRSELLTCPRRVTYVTQSHPEQLFDRGHPLDYGGRGSKQPPPQWRTNDKCWYGVAPMLAIIHQRMRKMSSASTI